MEIRKFEYADSHFMKIGDCAGNSIEMIKVHDITKQDDDTTLLHCIAVSVLGISFVAFIVGDDQFDYVRIQEEEFDRALETRILQIRLDMVPPLPDETFEDKTMPRRRAYE